MRRTGPLLAVVLLAVAFLPAASGHTVGQPLPIETHLLMDEGRDEFFWWDGYDLWTLYVREAFLVENATSGLVFRFTLYGGFGPAAPSQALHVDLGLTGPDAEQTWRLTTTDDRSWSAPGNASILSADVTEEDPPWTGVTSRMQVFVPYEAAGAGPGGTISGFRMASYADGDIRDVAPGGFFVPNSQGIGRIPSRNDQVGEAAYLTSRRLVRNLTLSGPVGYLERSVDVDGWNVTLDVENPFDDQGQHVVARTLPTAGWEVETTGPMVTNLGPGNATTFRFTARPTAAAAAPLPVELITDIGGRDRFYLGVQGGSLRVAPSPDALDVAPPVPAEATPGFAAWIAAAAGAVAVLWVRRR